MAVPGTILGQGLIGGSWVDAVGGETYAHGNPATGATLDRVPKSGGEDTRAVVEAARDAFERGPWLRLTACERQRIPLRLAEGVGRDIDRLGPLEVDDQGEEEKAVPEFRFLPRGGQPSSSRGRSANLGAPSSADRKDGLRGAQGRSAIP